MIRALALFLGLFISTVLWAAESADGIKVLAGSTAKATLLSGIELSLKSEDSGRVLVEITEITPVGGKPIPVSLRVIGTATAMPKSMRATITSTSASVAIRSELPVTMPCEGWFVDNLQGKAGALAEYSVAHDPAVTKAIIAGATQNAAQDTEAIASYIAAVDPLLSLPNGQALTFVFGQDTILPAGAELTN